MFPEKETFSFLEDKNRMTQLKRKYNCSEVSNCSCLPGVKSLPQVQSRWQDTRHQVIGVICTISAAKKRQSSISVWWSGVKSAERSSRDGENMVGCLGGIKTRDLIAGGLLKLMKVDSKTDHIIVCLIGKYKRYQMPSMQLLCCHILQLKFQQVSRKTETHK